jgi:hypothetical protein
MPGDDGNAKAGGTHECTSSRDATPLVSGDAKRLKPVI